MEPADKEELEKIIRQRMAEADILSNRLKTEKLSFSEVLAIAFEIVNIISAPLPKVKYKKEISTYDLHAIDTKTPILDTFIIDGFKSRN